MDAQRLYSFTRRAIDDYGMIEDGDKIAVGISGGKDSLTLLYALKGLERFYPKKFSLHAITIDLGFENLNLKTIIGRAISENIASIKVLEKIGLKFEREFDFDKSNKGVIYRINK